jgi:hypothetical protein
MLCQARGKFLPLSALSCMQSHGASSSWLPLPATPYQIGVRDILVILRADEGQQHGFLAQDVTSICATICSSILRRFLLAAPFLSMNPQILGTLSFNYSLIFPRLLGVRTFPPSFHSLEALQQRCCGVRRLGWHYCQHLSFPMHQQIRSKMLYVSASNQNAVSNAKMHYQDPSQSGYLPNHNMDPTAVANSLTIAWKQTFNLNEVFYAKPLVYTPIGAPHEYVITVSNQNIVRVHDGLTGNLITSRTLDPPFASSDTDCGDIPNTVGITGTPIIDPNTDIMYFFSKGYQNGLLASFEEYYKGS